jgi:hypothetical protein
MTKLAARPTEVCPACGHAFSLSSLLRRKIPVKEAAKIGSMSESNFRRHYSHLIVQLSPNRQGVTLADAYDLPPKK